MVAGMATAMTASIFAYGIHTLIISIIPNICEMIGGENYFIDGFNKKEKSVYHYRRLQGSAGLYSSSVKSGGNPVCSAGSI